MNFDKWANNANAFVKEVAIELGDPENTGRAKQVLRLVLHVLRDRLGIEQGFNLAAQLPMFVKAMFVDGWKPVSTPDTSIRNVDDFVTAMFEEDQRVATRIFGDREEASAGMQAVMRVLKNQISEGENADVAGMLPRDLRRMWEAA